MNRNQIQQSLTDHFVKIALTVVVIIMAFYDLFNAARLIGIMTFEIGWLLVLPLVVLVKIIWKWVTTKPDYTKAQWYEVTA